MAKLFAAVIPGSECENRVKEAAEISKIYDCTFNCKPMPEEHNANYYEVCFGENEGMARVMLDFVKNGHNGMMRIFSNDSIMMSVYGLYRVKILPDHFTLNQFIDKEVG